MTRGRKRRLDTSIPAHIEQGKIPGYCYWDKHKRHWYAFIRHEDRKPTRKRIAGSSAILGDLHRFMEELKGVETNTFSWLSGLYKNTPKFLSEIVSSTRKNYEGSEKILLSHPTRVNKLLGSVPLSSWNNRTVQKLIDQISTSNGPRAANMCLSYASLVFVSRQLLCPVRIASNRNHTTWYRYASSQ